VIATADDAGGATERYAYRAFGDTQVLAPDFTPSLVSISKWETTYGAYRYDPEARLYCVRFPYLHSDIGRWLSRDPVGEEADVNLYRYVFDSPVGAVDIFGLMSSPRQPCCGSFKLRFRGRLPVPESQQAAADNKEFLDGLEVEYIP
jgi:RHS repeat-associated protein